MNFAETLSRTGSQSRSQSRSKSRSKAASKTTTKSRSKTGSIDSLISLKAMQTATTGLLSRGLLWIQARNVARKSTHQLQVCSTVALGEKRFVSVIECNGLRFLIGGGAATVSLLAQLPASQDTNVNESVPVHSESAR